MWAFIGASLWRGGYVAWNFKTHPELYVVQSAPWYTGILLDGAFTLVALLICIVIKALIKHKVIK